MYRPWWFPERNPNEQALFDSIIEKVKEVFEQHNYQHIRTPAVESIDILKKWWDVVEQQVFGLYGLAQWVEDVKEYALHFDLTVPLARYVLDHRNDIVFPFSRYQMQPVWRWERTKRWRYKEFWQMDIDTIWPSESNVWVWYDVQSVYVMDKTMDVVADSFGVSIEKIAKISHLWLTKNFLSALWLSIEQVNSTCKILDAYYKKPHEETVKNLEELIGEEATKKLVEVVMTQDRSLLKDITWYSHFDAICTQLDILGVSYEYDICIVRWHNYYSGMVIEWLEKNDIALGSLAAWGRYDNLTDFIDPKQSFSWVGTSLGRFVYLVMEKIQQSPKQESYLFVNFEDTYTDTVALYKNFLTAGSRCEMYPTPAKLWKQFEYADRKGITHCVLLGSGEKENNICAIKNLETWITKTCGFDVCYGIVPVYMSEEWPRVLIIQHTGGHRAFPKWHPENNETPEQTAIRECAEETWLSNIDISWQTMLQEYYFLDRKNTHWRIDADMALKNVVYFIGYTKNQEITLQLEEVKNYMRATLEEAYEKATYMPTKKVVLALQKILHK